MNETTVDEDIISTRASLKLDINRFKIVQYAYYISTLWRVFYSMVYWTALVKFAHQKTHEVMHSFFGVLVQLLTWNEYSFKLKFCQLRKVFEIEHNNFFSVTIFNKIKFNFLVLIPLNILDTCDKENNKIKSTSNDIYLVPGSCSFE